MIKRTNKVLHSDTPSPENEISPDTVLEHNLGNNQNEVNIKNSKHRHSIREKLGKESNCINGRVAKIRRFNRDKLEKLAKDGQPRNVTHKIHQTSSNDDDEEGDNVVDDDDDDNRLADKQVENHSKQTQGFIERVEKICRFNQEFTNKFETLPEQAHKRHQTSSNDDDDEEEDYVDDDDEDNEDKQTHRDPGEHMYTDETEMINDIFKDSSEEMVLKTIHQLIHMGEDLNCFGKDEFGRSILHKAVERNFLSVVEKLLDYDFDPLCYDNNFNIPLHIAIDKGYDEMAALIVSKLDNFVVRRLFGDDESKANKFRGKSSVFKRTSLKINEDFSQFKTFNEGTVKPMFTINNLLLFDLNQTLLQVLDSFLEERPNGSYNVHIKLLDIDDNRKEPTHKDFDFKYHTAFHFLATLDKKDALNHPAVRTFVEHKWKNWGQARFLQFFILYLFSLFCLTYSAVTGVSAPDIENYDTRLQHSRAFFEVIAYLFALAVLFTEVVQIVRHRRSYFTQGFNILELTSAILLVMVLPLRYINVTVHWYFYAIGYCLWGMRIFKYTSVFNTTGIYAEVIKRIIVQDFVQFSILFAVVNLIFSGTFILILKADDNLNAQAKTSSFQGTMYVGLRTLIEASSIVEYSGEDGYRTAGTILLLVYMLFTIVALLNILIAQVSKTYTRTHGACVKTVRANRAWTVASAERNEWHILPCRQPNRVKHYLSVIKHVDLDAIKKKESTLVEEMSENIVMVEKQQIKNGLEIHTVKTRLRDSTQRIERKVNQLSRQMEKALHLLAERSK